jgi:hypothetical protein
MKGRVDTIVIMEQNERCLEHVYLIKNDILSLLLEPLSYSKHSIITPPQSKTLAPNFWTHKHPNPPARTSTKATIIPTIGATSTTTCENALSIPAKASTHTQKMINPAKSSKTFNAVSITSCSSGSAEGEEPLFEDEARTWARSLCQHDSRGNKKGGG